MQTIGIVGALLLLAAGLAVAGVGSVSDKDPQLLVHAVYFDLKDNSAAKQQELVDLCNKYLTTHDGCVQFTAGPRGKEFDREVNDQKFDVSLYVVFDSVKAHDKYQEHPRHLKFIEEGKGNWNRVRVFDSYIPAPE